MAEVPAWLTDMRTSVPAWAESVRHPDGPGRYRFTLNAYEPYDIDSSQNTYSTLRAIGHVFGDEERDGWLAYLTSMQREEDGLFVDAAMERHTIAAAGEPSPVELANVRRFITRNCITTILGLGGLPAYPLRHDEAFATPDELVRYLESLDWRNSWGAGSWAGAAIRFQCYNQLVGADEGRAQEVVDAGVRWLEERQDPASGAWSHGGEVRLNVLVNGIFKVWMNLLDVAALRVQYPERVVDLCLNALRDDPALVGTPDACSIFDVALVLDVALRRTDHRRDEVGRALDGSFTGLRPMVRDDGGFSYGPDGSLANHGGLALAPVADQSDAAGTAINVNAVALIANLTGAREDIGWLPVSEWQLGL